MNPVERAVVHSNPAEQKGYTIIPNAVLLDARLSLGARMVYGILKSYAWQEESCWPGQEKLGELIGVAPRNLRKYLAELKATELISVRRRGLGLTNMYVIKSPPDGTQTSHLEGMPASYKEDSVEERTGSSASLQNLSAAGNRNGRKRDSAYEALVTHFGPPANKVERGRLNATVKLLKETLVAEGVSLDDEERIRDEIGRRCFEAFVTFEQYGPMAIAANWTALGRSHRVSSL